MIEEKELVEIGKFGKPHGIHGEINVYLDDDVITDRIEKFIVNIDGIYVQFFIESIRLNNRLRHLPIMRFTRLSATK